MIRITSEHNELGVVVSVAGNLDSMHIAELEKLCNGANHPIVVDLSEVRSADAGALCWLSGLLARGGNITGASPYIKLLLERSGKASGTTGKEGHE